MALHSLPLLLFLLLLHGLIRPSSAGPLYTGLIRPNFTASDLLFVDTGGVFLNSPSSVFKASICNPGNQQSRFYLCVFHYPSNNIVWSANVSSPISSSGILSLTSTGLSISDNSTVVWSTPNLKPGVVSALRLLDSGNLVLSDASNVTLWQSFDYPTDTFVSGQRIPVGRFLTSSVSDTDLTPGDYKMVVTSSDAVLQWIGGQEYWSLSSDTRAYRNANAGVSYMEMNDTGLFLLSGDARSPTVVVAATLSTAALRIAKIDMKGQLTIISYVTASSGLAEDGGLTAPGSNCDLPFSCSTLGLCTDSSNASSCGCPGGFGMPSGSAISGCMPLDGSSLPSSTSCNASSSLSSSPAAEFMSLGNKVGYVLNKFAKPTYSGVNISSCQSFCSNNCSCLGFYYQDSTKSCYLLQYKLGSLFTTVNGDAGDSITIKLIPGDLTRPKGTNSSRNKHFLLPIVLPSIALVLLIVVLFLFLFRLQRRRSGLKKSPSSVKEIRLGKKSWPRDEEAMENDDNDDDDEILIPGMPTRFSYRQLDDATEGFKTRIGSGGFGEVYKGTLPDDSVVAVKRIANMGIHGRKEFFTEIAVIGKIRHINLVKLRGFCTQESRRLLVYEFMNRGSLDRSLFATGGKPVLEWQERVDIAVGAARGLAYLHGSCDQTIIHCDIKPENILLHDHNGVKISDFGLAKLLTPEQSSLFTTMRGTRGYLAPEWLTNSAISDRTDVYSFGMVLLEIVRGRRNCVTSVPAVAVASSELTTEDGMSSAGTTTISTEETYFPLVALERYEDGRYEELVDPRLQGRVTAAEVEKMVKIALCCLHEEPRMRPAMKTVAEMLDGTVPVWEPRVESLNFLRFYGREVVVPAVPVIGGGNRLARGYISTGTTRSTATSSSSPASLSYLSSEQVSGPR